MQTYHHFSSQGKHPLPPKIHFHIWLHPTYPPYLASMAPNSTAPAQRTLTQGEASRPAALADQALQHAQEQQGRVVWHHSHEHACDAADQGGGQET